MQYSIITPTHNPKYLLDTYESIVQATHSTWEWVIVLNGGVSTNDLDSTITENERVVIITANEIEDGKIGALKKLGCATAKGEYLIELDHDDLLTPDSLFQLSKAIDDESPDFIYSDFVEFEDKETNGIHKTHAYSSDYGWSTKQFDETYYFNSGEFRIKGESLVSFDITPAALSRIEYAPNHIRVWKKSFYDLIGGHDESMRVCDDYDLICRTYIAGAKCIKINHPIYLYRLTGDNTFIQKNDEIQRLNKFISEKYIYDITKQWCENNALEMLDLGGAHNSPEGFLSVDYEGADYNIDIAGGLPFLDNSVGCIRAVDFLEHIPTCKDSNCKHSLPYCTIGMMKEIHRVLVPNGVLLSMTPSSDGRGAFMDQTHVSFWNENSFWYYTNANFGKYYKNFETYFKAMLLKTDHPSMWHLTNNIPYVTANLVAIKDEIVAGEKQ